MMPTDTKPWDGDLLGFAQVGATFTKLVQSIDGEAEGSKVISIEAGFGRGKTFFRESWAEELRRAGEVVVEIDARQSDYSGDPVVTFIGALVGALGPTEETRLKKAKDAGLKYGGLLGRTVVRAAVGKAADELFDTLDRRLEGRDANDLLKAAVEGFGDGMSKFASETIAAQLVAEDARTKEMPQQLDALRKALTAEAQTDRVVILLDELDRCHPDYAIALLEAMKLVFDRPGYVFVLMVNSDHLERIAAHRFVGWHKDEGDAGQEPYLDKFVDMRLKLAAGEEKIGEAARALALELPEPGVPFGDGPEFTVARAAQVAADLAPVSGLSLRQIKRVLLRVRLALVTHTETPVDVALLVWLGFGGAELIAQEKKPYVLARANITPSAVETWAEPPDWRNWNEKRLQARGKQYREFIDSTCDALYSVPRDLYRFTDQGFRNSRDSGERVLHGLAPWYIPEHQAMLDAVHKIAAD